MKKSGWRSHGEVVLEGNAQGALWCTPAHPRAGGRCRVQSGGQSGRIVVSMLVIIDVQFWRCPFLDTTATLPSTHQCQTFRVGCGAMIFVFINFSHKIAAGLAIFLLNSDILPLVGSVIFFCLLL